MRDAPGIRSGASCSWVERTNPQEGGGRKEGVRMALGDQLGDSSGRITGTRVITPVVGAPAQIEVAFQGSGTMLG